MAVAHQFHDETARRRHDLHDVPGAGLDEPAAHESEHAAHAMADIGLQFGFDAELDPVADLSGPDTEHAPAGPDTEQLALHGPGIEPSQVDPGATATAQAALDTGVDAAPPEQDADADAGDAGGPEAGTVQQAAPAETEPGQPVIAAAPQSVLAGAAQGLQSAITETPAAGGGAGSVNTPAGDASVEAAPQLAAEPEAAPAAPEQARASTWEDRARAYNQRQGLVEQFNAATGNTVGSGADADPRAVAAWQEAHGVKPDGRIGPATLGAAIELHATATAEASVEAPAKPEPVEARPEPVEARPEPVEARPEPKAVAKPEPKAVAKPEPKAEAKPVAKPIAAVTPTAAVEADSFIGAEEQKGKAKDRWASYGKGDAKTYGWDIGGSHGAKHSGGATSAAIYAVSNVEGRYDSVQTYDAGILSFGIMQWTLHAGSLQKFLGFLKDKSGPDGRAAFQDLFIAKGIDVKLAGGNYQLVWKGTEYPLSSDGEGKAAIDKLVRENKETARVWVDIFHAAGADARVQKAQFERAKEMFKEAQGVKFGDKVVDQSLKACKKTFFAKYREHYGKAETWMSASPKAAALYFSMRVNNPKYANAAFLKAIDGFYDAHGTDRAKWPASWGDSFGNIVADKCKETLDSWNSEGGSEGRVQKTLRFWDKANAQGAAAPTVAATPAAKAPAPAEKAAAKVEQKAQKAEAKPEPDNSAKLRAQYQLLIKQFNRDKIDQSEAVQRFIAFDRGLNDGSTSLAGLVLLPGFLVDLVKITVEKARTKQAADAAKQAKEAAPAKPATAKAAPKATPKAEVAAPGEARASTTVPEQATAGSAIKKVYNLPGLPTVRAFIPPGGVKGIVDVFAFFHGMYAVHDDAKHPDRDDPERESHMAEAVAASGRNMVALSPAAEMTQKQWPQWAKLDKNKGYDEIVRQSLKHLSMDLGLATPLSVGTISLAGHSAGASALGEAASQLGDAVQDVTLQDGGYTSAAFLASHEKLVEWLLSGKVDKTVRVITHGEPSEVSEGNVLKKFLNAGSIKQAAKGLKLEGVTVTEEKGDKDPLTVKGMTLHHTLHIGGLTGTRTVTVYNFRSENHFKVRDKTMGALIGEGPDADFEHDEDAVVEQVKQAPPPGKTAPRQEPAKKPAVKVEKKAAEAPAKVADKPAVSADVSTADLGDLDGLVAGLGNAQVSKAAASLRALVARYEQVAAPAELDNNELKGPAREEIVAGIARVHAEIATLDHAGVDQAKLAPIKSRMYRTLQDISPFHSQGRNVDILERGEKDRARVREGGIKTRTCNITSLAMALEGLGRSAADYNGDRDVITAVAEQFAPELKHAGLKGTVEAGSGDWGAVQALRLPDFMELAAIAQLTKGKSDKKSIWDAGYEAFDKILNLSFLRDLALKFDVDAQIKYFAYDDSQTRTVKKKGKDVQVDGSEEFTKLAGQSKDQRSAVDKLIDLRNKMEALEGGNEKKYAAAKKAYEAQKKLCERGLSGAAIEKDVPLEKYKQAVIDYLGAELATGAAVETHVVGHYVRLQAIHDDHVVIDDPAQYGRASKKVLWEEARAQAMFDKRLVLR